MSYADIVNVAHTTFGVINVTSCPCFVCCIGLGAKSYEDGVHCSDPEHLIAGAKYIGTRKLSKTSSYVHVVTNVLSAGLVMDTAGLRGIYHHYIGRL
jgi:hypothetical protein